MDTQTVTLLVGMAIYSAERSRKLTVFVGTNGGQIEISELGSEVVGYDLEIVYKPGKSNLVVMLYQQERLNVCVRFGRRGSYARMGFK